MNPDPGLPRPDSPVFYLRLVELFREIARNFNTGKAAFLAHRNGTNLTLTVDGTNQVLWTTADIDTGAFYSTTTHRYTPLPGNYLVTTVLAASAAAWGAGFVIGQIRKNGTQVQGAYCNTNSLTTPDSVTVTTIINCNGTDYIDVAVQNTGTPTTPVLQGAANRSWLAIQQI